MTKKPTTKSHVRLTIKQLQFIKFYAETNGNGTESARLAGYKGKPNTLAVVAKENLTKPNILEAIERAKEASGLTDELLLAKHLELLEATRPQQDGKKEVPDYRVQLGALNLAYEVGGKIKRKIEYAGNGPTHLHFISVLIQKAHNIDDYKTGQQNGAGLSRIDTAINGGLDKLSPHHSDNRG